jgi:hypothetical protein
LRINLEDIGPMHTSTLVENLRVTGLTLAERKALYHHLRGVGPIWTAQQADKIGAKVDLVQYYDEIQFQGKCRFLATACGPVRSPYTTRDNPNHGCPVIVTQRPLKAGKLIDYDGDYGFPEGNEYFESEVKKSDVDNVSKAKQEALEGAREKKAQERTDALTKQQGQAFASILGEQSL